MNLIAEGRVEDIAVKVISCSFSFIEKDVMFSVKEDIKERMLSNTSDNYKLLANVIEDEFGYNIEKMFGGSYAMDEFCWNVFSYIIREVLLDRRYPCSKKNLDVWKKSNTRRACNKIYKTMFRDGFQDIILSIATESYTRAILLAHTPSEGLVNDVIVIIAQYLYFVLEDGLLFTNLSPYIFENGYST